MSDYRAIAAVTGTLQQFLSGPLSGVIPGTAVRTGPPSASLMTGSPAALNIFLYQINPNANWRNAELPWRRSDGSIEKRPQVALDLYYLLSFYGSESKMVPQLLLGAAVSALHANPSLDSRSIPQFLDGKSLEGCGLAEQAQVIQFTLMPLSHEELGRIWSVFFQVPYTLSVAYQCSVVLVEPDLTPQPALPVLGMRIGALPWEPARIDRVEPAVVEYEEGAVIRLEGSGFAGPSVSVRFGGVEVQPTMVTDDLVETEIPPSLLAGVNTVQVLHRQAGSAVPISRSNPASFVLVPKVTGPVGFETREIAGTKTRMVVVPVAPPVAPGQRAELLLNEWPPPEGRAPRSYQIKADPTPAEGGQVSFSIDGVEPGAYLLRVEIDGVASRLSTQDEAASPEFGRYTAPRITIG